MKRLIQSVAALMLISAAVLAAGVATSAAEAAPRSQGLVLYSVAQQEQYINNSDARRAGAGPNPFGNFNDVAPSSKNAKGPFPGDEALYSFNLYTNASLKTRAGSAIFTCQYNFNLNAFCDVSFQLNRRGTLIAAGAFNFNAAKFTLAVTGGYGAFVGTTGIVEATPSANHAQRLRFQLG